MTKSKQKSPDVAPQARAGMDPFAGITSVSEFFVWYRARAGLAQRDLAEKLGCTGGYVAQIESDFYDFPIAVCRKFAKLLSPPEKAKLLSLLRDSISLDEPNEKAPSAKPEASKKPVTTTRRKSS